MTKPTIREWRLLINGPTVDDHGGVAHLYIRDDDGWFHKSFDETEEVGDIRRFYGLHREWPHESPPEGFVIESGVEISSGRVVPGLIVGRTPDGRR